MQQEEINKIINNYARKQNYAQEEQDLDSLKDKQRTLTKEEKLMMKTMILPKGETLHSYNSKDINSIITRYKEDGIINNAKDISDGYHTFKELYDMRLALTVAVFKANHWKPLPNGMGSESLVWRAKKHFDGTMFDGMFIVCHGYEQGTQISFHYNLEHWDKFNFANTSDIAPVPYDGHTDEDVIERLINL